MRIRTEIVCPETVSMLLPRGVASRGALVVALAGLVSACGGDGSGNLASGGSMANAGSGGESGGSGGKSGGAGGESGGTDAGPPPAPGEIPFAMDECDLDTGYAGDEFCILPPPPNEGFQVHVGPSDYDDPDEVCANDGDPAHCYILQPGEERTDDFQQLFDNPEDVFFYYRQYRVRPTAHHMIISALDGSSTASNGFGLGSRIGTANASEDYPAGGVIAPENKGVGLPLAGNSTIDTSLHAINVTENPQLREVWVNFWYRDASEVTEPAIEWFKVGDVTFDIQPYEATTLGPYQCTIDEPGRLLWLYGHRHANNVSFNVTRTRGDQTDVIYTGLDWEEPLLLEYNSLTENVAPDLEADIEGGWSGKLELLPGDVFEWQCEVVNQQDVHLRFTNNTYTGEMCIIDAEAVGSSCTGGF